MSEVSEIDQALAVWADYARRHARWDDSIAAKARAFLIALRASPHRLVGNADPVVVVSDHCIDSLEPLRLGLSVQGCEVLDVGSGAGFPGLPLYLCGGPAGMTLLDSRAKPTDFLHAVAGEWENLRIVRARTEDAVEQAEHRARYDLVVARAVADLETLLRYCAGFIKSGGHLWAYKGPLEAKEREHTAKAARAFDLFRVETLEYTLFETDRRRALIIYQRAVV